MAKTSSPTKSGSEPTGSSSSSSSSSATTATTNTTTSNAKARINASGKTADKSSSTDTQVSKGTNSSSLLSKMVVALAVLAALALATFTLVPYVNTDAAGSGANDVKASVDFQTHKSNLHSLGLFNIQTQEHFEAVKKHTCALVVYKATWCGHCKKLMPKLEEAANDFAKITMPKDASGVISFVECTEEGAPKDLCEAAEIQGYPTLHLYSYGEKNTKFAKYDRESIFAAMKDCVLPAFNEITAEDASAISKLGSAGHKGTKPLVLFYFKDLKSDDFKAAFESAKKLKFNFKVTYTTDESLFAKLLKEAKAKRTELQNVEAALIHSEEAPIILNTEGKSPLTESAITAWTELNKIPLVGVMDPETYEMYSTAGKRILFFFYSDDAQRTKFRKVLTRIAKKHQKTTFVVFLDANKFGGHGTQMGLPGIWPDVAVQNLITGEKWLRKESLAAAAAMGAAESSTDGAKTLELTEQQIEKLADGVNDGTHDAHLKSEPVPTSEQAYETPKSPRNIVSLNFDDVVINQKVRDVVVFFHAPWCGHCKSFSPTYSKIAELLHDNKVSDSIELTKLDATKNDVPKSAAVSIRGFPTIVLYRADDKTPITYEGDRSYEGVLKWLTEKGANGSKVPAASVSDEFVKDESVANEDL